MAEDIETDIGSLTLSHPSDSPPGRSLSLRSPSSPHLPRNKSVQPRRLSRSNTLPRLPSSSHKRTGSMDGLSMEPEKIVKLRRWLQGLAIVDFDLDVGPKICSIYPPLDLTPSEAENIAFSSFPDSAQFEEGAQVHSFRIRLQDTSEADPEHAPGAPRPTEHDGFLYGFSYFSQRRDASSRRGYQQRSLVILTHFSYPAIFYALLAKLGPMFMAHGGPMLESACHNIAGWPDPCPGISLELGFLGAVLNVLIPHTDDAQQGANSAVVNERRGRLATQEPPILVSLAPSDPPILTLFEASFSHLWSIWECLVLCEPILIFGSSPAMTSQAIWWLRDLIRPIPFAGDFRPFFTIHDAEHAVLVNPRPPRAGLLLGVTNPFFERACKHWPHALSLGRIPPKKSRRNREKESSIGPGPSPGWTTHTHKRYISRDRALLKRLEDACSMSNDDPRRAALMRDASTALREHFSARTAALLVPLQRYLQSLIPTPSESAYARGVSPLPRTSLSSTSLSTGSSASLPRTANNTPPPGRVTPVPAHARAADGSVALRLKPFSERAFLASLASHGAALPFKSGGRRQEFYTRWLRTPAFGVWLARQEEAVGKVLSGESRGRG
ncbi:DUF1630-domain-containing protein [Obba rivulosa]|uniref:DUF1630-domain-containing protein n=1 Tax=Obba rivulosa TaxID=1052685 RepID=A0A8E2DTM5_9APHY|nr:DUF1630-domain-containing protein [Obba rivulosa]